MSDAQRLPSRCWTILACVALLASPAVAHAQIEAGQVIDDSLRTPLHQVAVSLLHLTDSTWRVIDTTRTNDRGLFQLAPGTPGIYRIRISPPDSRDFLGPVDTLAVDSVNERAFRVPLFAQVTRIFQLSQSPRPVNGTRPPEYPRSLLGLHIEGSVDVQFVIDEHGLVDQSTVKILRTSDPEFSESVRKYLRTAQYVPAAANGKPVRQTVTQSFMFGAM